MNQLRLVFFGTPQFALASLEALLAAGLTPSVVVTQPDKPAGRGQRLTAPPVKVFAQTHGLAVLQPDKPGQDQALLTALREADVAVVVAYGKLIPANLLALPQRGFVNLHPSLLPRHRGATPIPAAILAGDTQTGVSLMVLDEGLDTGPVIAQTTETIQPTDTTESLGTRLSQRGAALLRDALTKYAAGSLVPIAQNEKQVSVSKPLTKQDGEIDWKEPALVIERKIRAFQPWPSAWFSLNDQPVKILRARVLDDRGQPGRVFPHAPLRVGCGQGSLEIIELQFAGGKPQSAVVALRGRKLLNQQLSLRSTIT